MNLNEKQFGAVLKLFGNSISMQEVNIPEDFSRQTMLRIRRDRARSEESRLTTSLSLWNAALGSMVLTTVAIGCAIPLLNSFKQGLVELIITQGALT